MTEGRFERTGTTLMRNGLRRLPTWLKVVIVAASWAGAMLLLKATRGEPIGWEAVLVWTVFGALFAAVQLGLNRAQVARFDPIDGPPLTAEERAAAMAAVRAGHPPADHRVADAARLMAQFRVDQYAGPIPLLILLLGCAAAVTAMAIWSNPGWWPAAVSLLVLAPFAVRAQQRGREAARRYLAMVEASGAVKPSTTA
jgi:hypothetical protein